MVELNLKPRKSFSENGVQFGWDATSISLAQTCLRKYQYGMIEGWRGNAESEHLKFGKHFADALEHYYKYVALGADWVEALEQVVLEAMVATVEHTESGEVRPWVSTDSVKTRENLIRSIVWYVDEFQDEKLTVMKRVDGTPAVELSFQLSVDDGIIFSGHLDRVVEVEGELYVMDQKTTKQTISPYWFRQFKPHTQFGMYTFAGKAILQTPMKGVLIDGAQIAVGFTRFERAPVLFTENELEEWYEGAHFWIAQAQAATLAGHFPMNPASCGNYGGCEFRDVCSRSPGLRKNFLAGGFHQNDPWDPLVVR
jgi:hypothetical protein